MISIVQPIGRMHCKFQTRRIECVRYGNGRTHLLQHTPVLLSESSQTSNLTLTGHERCSNGNRACLLVMQLRRDELSVC